MSQIKQMLESNTPFSVMQYFESFKGIKTETRKKYELIYLNKRNQISYKILDADEIYIVKKNTDKIPIVLDNQDGRVYEFNNFKQYAEANLIL